MTRDPRQVLDAVQTGLVVLDRKGDVELVNPEACRIAESSSDALLGGPIERVLGPEHPATRLARSALARGRAAVEADLRVPHRFDADLIVDVSASPLLDAEGRCDGAVLVLRDRTIHAALRAMVDERERLESFGRIAAGIAHELKNPLGGIRGAAELLAGRAETDKARETASLIVREVDRIADLVDDLMVFARGDALHEERLNLHQVLDEVLDLIAHDRLARAVHLSRHYDPSIPELRADRNRLIQVFLNLTRNALQALEPAGGRLEIRTRMRFEHALPAGGGNRGAVTVEVADSGPGIPEELLEKVATPLFTTRAGGTGLGLPLAEHWVARHGGSLQIESRPGEGTRIHVTLPVERER